MFSYVETYDRPKLCGENVRVRSPCQKNGVEWMHLRSFFFPCIAFVKALKNLSIFNNCRFSRCIVAIHEYP